MPKEGRNRGQISAAGQTASATGQYVLGAGWGASTQVVSAGSNDIAGQLVVPAVTGGGLAQATATCVFTFATPYAAAPRMCIAFQTNDNDITKAGPLAWSVTTTALTLTQLTIPVNGGVYKLNYTLVA